MFQSKRTMPCPLLLPDVRSKLTRAKTRTKSPWSITIVTQSKCLMYHKIENSLISHKKIREYIETSRCCCHFFLPVALSVVSFLAFAASSFAFCSSSRFLAASSLCFRIIAKRAKSALASSVFPAAWSF